MNGMAKKIVLSLVVCGLWRHGYSMNQNNEKMNLSEPRRNNCIFFNGQAVEGFSVDNEKLNDALAHAVLCGDVERFNELLQKGANPNARNVIGQTPLICAAVLGRVNGIRMLCGIPGIDLNAQDMGGETALMHAVSGGYLQVVQLLLGLPGIDVNVKDAFGNTALMKATCCSNVQEVQLLLNTPGIDANIKNEHGNTALMQAVRCGKIEVVSLFLDAFANFTLKNNDGHTALDLARLHRHDDIVSLLEAAERHQKEKAQELATLEEEWLQIPEAVIDHVVAPYL